MGRQYIPIWEYVKRFLGRKILLARGSDDLLPPLAECGA
jgi:hypothetical protein